MTEMMIGDMKIIENKIIPFKGFKAVNICGIVFVRKGTKMSALVLNHEAIHTAQMKEMLYIFFYIWYTIEWIVRLIGCRNGHEAYRNIAFEQEAYGHDEDMSYLERRKHFVWWQYIRR